MHLNSENLNMKWIPHIFMLVDFKFTSSFLLVKYKSIKKIGIADVFLNREVFESKCVISVYTSDQTTYCQIFYTLINIKLVSFQDKIFMLKTITSTY